MPSHRIAVVIVNWNEGSFLERSLPALAAQERAPDRVVVVDNGSTDGSREMVRERFPHFEVLELGRNAGFAAANNAGVAAAADCDLIALLNPDAFPEPGWLAALERAAAEHPEHAAFASLMKRANEPGLVDAAGDCYHVSGLTWNRDHLVPLAESRHAFERGEVFSACAGAALYRREAFVAVGGFAESHFVYWEDSDLSFKLRLAGHGVRYVPDAVVHHVGSGTTGVLSDFSIYHSQRNFVWAWVRNMPLPLLVAYLPWHLAANAAGVWALARAGHGDVVLRAKRDALRGLGEVLRERRRVQRSRRISSRELLRTMSRGLDASVVMPSLVPLRRALGR